MRSPARRRAAVALILALSAPLVSRQAAPTWAAFAGSTADGPNSLAAASSFYQAFIVADAPVSYWRMGETTGTAAVDVMGASNGAYTAGYTLGSTGALVADPDKAVDLNGANGRIMVPHVAAYDMSTAVTIEVWAKPAAISATRWIVNEASCYYLYILNSAIIFGIHTVAGDLFVSSTHGSISSGHTMAPRWSCTGTASASCRPPPPERSPRPRRRSPSAARTERRRRSRGRSTRSLSTTKH